MADLALDLSGDLGGDPVGTSDKADAYARQLKQLLPPGALWLLNGSSWLEGLLLGLADELARIDDRGEDLVNEWSPGTAVETLGDWERVLGITSPAATTAARQAAAAAKYIARGGQDAAYYVAIAAALGFTVAIAETAPHTWRLDVFTLQSTSTDHASLEAAISQAKPAHTVLTFNYVSGSAWGVAGLTWGSFTWGR